MYTISDFTINILEVFNTSRDIYWGVNTLTSNYGLPYGKGNKADLVFILPTENMNDCPGFLEGTYNEDCLKTDNDEICMDPFRSDVCSGECQPYNTALVNPPDTSQGDVTCGPPDPPVTFVEEDACPKTDQFVCRTNIIQYCLSMNLYPCDSGGPCQSVYCNSNPNCTHDEKECPGSNYCQSDNCPDPEWVTIENNNCLTKNEEICKTRLELSDFEKSFCGYFCPPHAEFNFVTDNDEICFIKKTSDDRYCITTDINTNI